MEAKQNHITKLQEDKENQVHNAIIKLQNQDLKITISAISRITGMDRKTVRKYLSCIKI